MELNMRNQRTVGTGYLLRQIKRADALLKKSCVYCKSAQIIAEGDCFDCIRLALSCLHRTALTINLYAVTFSFTVSLHRDCDIQCLGKHPHEDACGIPHGVFDIPPVFENSLIPDRKHFKDRDMICHKLHHNILQFL